MARTPRSTRWACCRSAPGPRHPPRDLAGLSPIQRGLLIGDVEAAGTPILLVHGMVDNRSIFTVLRRGLRRRGFGRVLTLNYSPLTNDVRLAAAELGRPVERLCAETGFERIHVIGHSMGGMIARYYVQRLGGDARVHTLVTLGLPAHGHGRGPPGAAPAGPPAAPGQRRWSPSCTRPRRAAGPASWPCGATWTR